MPFDLFNFDQRVIGFVLVFFRVAGLMLFAPLFGSTRVPRRFKILIALVMTLPMIANGLPPKIPMPNSLGELTVGLAGELCFGLVLGLVVSLVFIAAQWSGEMVGQQIGLNMGETLDPQFGAGGTVVSDLYFMIATAAFLVVGGHRQMVAGVYESLTLCPPMTTFFNANVLDSTLEYLHAATQLALRISAPMFVTMMIVDISMGCISKTMPQLNVMSAGMAVRGIIGTLVLALGIGVVGAAIGVAMQDHLDHVNEFIHPVK